MKRRDNRIPEPPFLPKNVLPLLHNWPVRVVHPYLFALLPFFTFLLNADAGFFLFELNRDTCRNINRAPEHVVATTYWYMVALEYSFGLALGTQAASRMDPDPRMHDGYTKTWHR